MSTCGHKCLGGGSCVKTCIKGAEGYSDACSGCFGDLAQCTKDHCMLKCIKGESDACKSCVKDNCDAAFTTCSGISDIPGEQAWATKMRATPIELALKRLEAA